MKKIFKLVPFITVLILVFIMSSINLAYEDEIKSLTKDLAPKIVNAKKKVIGVADFTDLQGNVTELGRFLAEELSVSLAGSANGFEVVDRTHLKALVKEYKLSLSGLIDPTTAKKLGQIAGADAFITGTLTPFGDSIRLAVKVLDAGTAKIITAATANIAKTKAIEEIFGTPILENQPTPNDPQPTATTSKQKTEANGFIFELQGFKKSGTSLICNLVVLSTEDDKNLVILWNETEMFDNNGNNYRVRKVQIGNKDDTCLLVKGVPTKLVLVYTDINPVPSKISLLKIEGGSYTTTKRDNKFLIQFRDIPIQ